MKQTKLALSAVMIVAVGLIGTNFATGSEMIGQEKFDVLSNSNTVYGHLIIVHSDPDGNILSYIQTDNVVSSNGLDCMALLVFGTISGTSCESTDKDTVFDTIGLFEDESFTNSLNASSLQPAALTEDGLQIGNGTSLTVSKNADAVPNGDKITMDSGSKTDISLIFTAGSLTSQVVNGAALFNNDEDAVLAGQSFNPVTLETDDTLTITWTIELG